MKNILKIAAFTIALAAPVVANAVEILYGVADWK